jgi:hypothetical protein
MVARTKEGNSNQVDRPDFFPSGRNRGAKSSDTFENQQAVAMMSSAE